MPDRILADRPDPQVRRWIRRELAAAPPRGPSLIITVWGDAIAPHGGAVMLSGLIRLLAPFGINERLRAHQRVPAGPRRLAQGDAGRTPQPLSPERDGARRFEHAYRRIYAPRVERLGRHVGDRGR